TGADLDVEAREATRRQPELRLLCAGHTAVEDDARVGAALVLEDEVDDRMSADFLLPVAGDAEVHRQRAVCAQQLRRLEQREELALVVCDATRVVPAVPLR